MGTGILNRRHFDFYHEDAPCFKLDILNLNFPPHMLIVLFFCQFEVSDLLVLRQQARFTCERSWVRSQVEAWQFFPLFTKSGGKFKLNMSNLKQGASPW